MPQIDIVDSTWIGVSAGRVGRAVADPANWARWWPRLEVEVTQARGAKGMRWRIPSGEAGTVSGSMEVWLEPVTGVSGGVVAHYFLRLDGTAGALSVTRARRLTHRYRTGVKRIFWGIADDLDPGRLRRLAARPGR